MTRILIVDDEDKIRLDLQELFTSKGYETIEASGLTEFTNTIEAIQFGDEKPIDLILLDHQLDPYYGWDLLDKVRNIFGEDCCRYQFVICTSNPDIQLNARYQKLGSLNHIVKPYRNALHIFWNTVDAALIDPRRELYRGPAYWSKLSWTEQASVRASEFNEARSLSDYERVFRIATSWLIYYAEKDHYEGVVNVINSLVDISSELDRTAAYNFGSYFDIFESLVPYSIDHPHYRDLIADKYLMIAFKAIDIAHFKNKPVSGIVRNIRLYFREFFPQYDQELTAYLEEKLKDKQLVNLEYSNLIEPSIEEEWSLLSLEENLCIGLAGGHASVRKSISEEFSEQSRLEIVEVPPSSEVRVGTSYVKDRLHKCDLIVLITGYMGHDLSRNVMSLHKAGQLRGDILTPKCRGSSGVIREIKKAILQLI